MGLFSFLSKNKQESTGEDSGYYNADDTAVAAQARSKRASNAGGAARRSAKPAVDPVLPEKKRARRRLVGAIALALAVAIGLPMILDSEQKPLASDIAFQIPSKDKPAADPAAATPPADTGNGGASSTNSANSASAPSSKVPATAALDQSEEIVAPPANPPAKAAPAAVAKPAATLSDDAEVAKADAKAAAKADAEARARRDADAKREARADSEARARLAEAKPVPAKPRAEDKPAPNADDDARALAILEGKTAPKGEAKGDTPNGSSKFIVQVAALATQDKADELQGKLRDAGIKSYTQKTPSGDTIRVRVGPLSKDEAEKVRARLAKIGLSGSLVPA